MATPTYTLIDSVTLASSASSVTFSGIIQDYRDLILVASATATSSFYTMLCQLNGDTGTNYSWVYMRGTGSVADSGSSSSADVMLVGRASQSPQPSADIIQFMDYSATDKHKTVISRTNGSDATLGIANRWASTSAVTSILLYSGGTFAAGSTFYLYGIEA